MGTVCPSATPTQYMVFFFGLYLIALGTGGIKPCVSSFGADQFDDTNPKEREGLAKIKEVLDTVMNIYMKTMTEDDDKEVVAQACMSIADIIKEYGYVAIEQYVPRLVDATLVLLREESCCQQEESDGDIDDDDTKHDEELMDAVSDLLPAFARSMGSHFAPIFAKLFDPLMKFARAARPLQDRTMVVACLAEVAQDMGPPIAAYVDVP